MTPTQHTCPTCKANLKTAKPLAPGSAIRCPKCATTFRIPAAPPAPGSARAAAPSSAARPQTPPSAAPKKAAPAPPAPARKPAPAPPPVDEEDELVQAPRPAARKSAVVPSQTRRPAESIEDDLDEEEVYPQSKPAGKPWLGLRISVLMLALFSSLAAGAIALKWRSDATSPEVQKTRELIEQMEKNPKLFPPAAVSEAREGLQQLDKVVTAAYVLLGMVPLALLGALLALFGLGKIGGLLLLAAVAAPAFLQPITLMLTFGFLAGGMLSFLIGPSRKWNISIAIAALLYIGGWFGLIILWGAIFVAVGSMVQKKDPTGGPFKTQNVPVLTAPLA